MRGAVGVFLAIALSSAFGQPVGKLIDAPRIWNDHDLAEWATPVAGLNVRPRHYSEREYYSGPVAEWVRTYPVYFPGREPAGTGTCYEMLNLNRSSCPAHAPWRIGSRMANGYSTKWTIPSRATTIRSWRRSSVLLMNTRNSGVNRERTEPFSRSVGCRLQKD